MMLVKFNSNFPILSHISPLLIIHIRGRLDAEN